MSDEEFIKEIAKKWVELNGDAEGVEWLWRMLKEQVEEIGGAK